MSEPDLLPREGLEALFTKLKGLGYEVIGPTVGEGVITYQSLDSPAGLPWGMSEQQRPGHYRLEAGPADRAFAWANGPQALKPLLFAPRECLWRASRSAEGIRFEEVLPPPRQQAIIGVRPCDLAALELQDAHFLGGVEADPHYAARRRGLFIVAVNCTHPADTCFCASTGDGPAVPRSRANFDLLLDELGDGYLIRAGSEPGRKLLAQFSLTPAGERELSAAHSQSEAAAKAQQRRIPGRDLQSLLYARLEHPRWTSLEERCLACGNCTSVCPSCFCHSEHDEPHLSGIESEHLRQWDSCFSPGHSYIHGLTLRPGRHQRYRQWLTHKFGGWHEQYGRSGCVGCGRCISWCPVGIDVTEELQALCGGAQ